MMLFILLFVPGDYAGLCFIGFAIGESLAPRAGCAASSPRSRTSADLMKIVFKIKDDVRNPGVIADCTGDNAGDSVGPGRRLRDLRRDGRGPDHLHPAGGFSRSVHEGRLDEVAAAASQKAGQLLVWIFVMRIGMS